ncbi:MAG: 50S ribosomal protein L17 [Saprospiraceae bacterium]
MRHGKKDNHLGRKVGHRRALLKNLAQALIQHKRITTTVAKAKALRVYIEPLVTKAKTNTTHNRRVVFSYLQNKEAVKELFSAVAEKIGDRPGGYVRVIRTGYRQGDGAEMAMIEFVDFNDVYNTGKEAGAGKSTRRRRRRGGSGGTKEETRAAAPAAVATTPEATAPEVAPETNDMAATSEDENKTEA